MIKLREIYKSFGKNNGRVDALLGVSFDIKKGEMVAIMGKSGSGKSTILNIMGGLIYADSGEYIYNGETLKSSDKKRLTQFRRNEVGFVVQYFALVQDLTVFQNVALPLKYKGYGRKKIKRMVTESLNELGIEEKSKAYPNELSGGQQQRTAIARAIVKRPQILLADEPTGSLDETTGIEVMNIFRKLNREGMTVVIVTHDTNIAGMCDRIINIKDGKICSDATNLQGEDIQ